MRESSSVTSTQIATDTFIAPGNEVSAIQTHSYLPVPYRRALLGADGTGNIHDVGASAKELSAKWSWTASAIGPALIDQAGTVFEARGGVRVLATHRDGSVAVFDLPSAAEGTPTLDGKPIKGNQQGGGSAVSGLAPGANGEVFAFVSNGINSLVVGLNSKRQASLGPYGVILDAATGADGQLEALAYDPRLSTNDIVLLGIDPSSQEIRQTIDTGVNPRSGGAYLHTHALVVTSSAMFIYIVLQSTPPAAVQESSLLLEVGHGSASATSFPISNSAGLGITAGSDGRIYLFGGPALNGVSVLDPTSGSVGPAAYLSSPEGSFVRAVFV
jgi:hypothetical protein